MMRLLICLLAAASVSSVYAKSRVVNEIFVTESGDLGTLALHQPSFRAWLDDPEPANYKSYDWSTARAFLRRWTTATKIRRVRLKPGTASGCCFRP